MNERSPPQRVSKYTAHLVGGLADGETVHVDVASRYIDVPTFRGAIRYIRVEWAGEKPAQWLEWDCIYIPEGYDPAELTK